MTSHLFSVSDYLIRKNLDAGYSVIDTLENAEEEAKSRVNWLANEI